MDTAGPVTIRDVAERAGVSHQTVSRYLRFGGAGVRDAYRERIAAAIGALGYQPNLAARAMRTRRTGRLAVLLPAGTAHSTVEVLDGAAETARAAGYSLDVLALGGDPAQRTQRALELIGSGLFEAILSLTPLGLPAAQGSGPVIVEVPLYDDALHGIGELADAAAVEVIVDGLAAMGHRTLIHLAGSYEHESARMRREAYLRAVARLGLVDHGVIECRWQPALAMRAVANLPEEAGVTAVVAANDVLALGAIRGAAARGWRVPDDISVTGFDTTTMAHWMSPSLSSVRIDHEELGRRAGARLLDALGHDSAPVPVAPAMTVIWRESTAPPPSTR